ncbi:conserved membrane hypothetical protein [Pseudomonas sp. 8BK]|uniref:hypothetical protein n=1 Tax=Pseudomonas sp. 8BK TaxID=2653164 RepID=UPI0012F06DD1|nr:hypothetical protein [Pseudomonas sp. 8BK]VXC03700.1 conserved membrane hypothetical protein [Pseudomonas sp. 8BK]
MSNNTNIEEDAIDKTIAKFEAFALKHLKEILTIAPPIIGLSIFLSYFVKQGFYPSFDILQFSSLLIFAFIIGAILILSIASALAAPGFIYKSILLSHDKSKKKLRIHFINPDESEDRIQMFFVYRILIFYPILFGGLLNWLAVFSFSDHYMPIFFTIPLFISLIFCAISSQFLEFQASSIFALFLTLLIAVLMSNFSILTIILVAKEAIFNAGNDIAQSAVILIGSIFISLVISISCIAVLGGIRYLLYACIIFSAVILFYGGVLTSFPSKFINMLSLGNYTATSLVLTKDFCEIKNFPVEINEKCELTDAHIIWSLGDHTLARVESKAGGTYRFQIQNKYIRAIVRKNSKSDNIKN